MNLSARANHRIVEGRAEGTDGERGDEEGRAEGGRGASGWEVLERGDQEEISWWALRISMNVGERPRPTKSGKPGMPIALEVRFLIRRPATAPLGSPGSGATARGSGADAGWRVAPWQVHTSALRQFLSTATTHCSAKLPWVPCRPSGYPTHRVGCDPAGSECHHKPWICSRISHSGYSHSAIWTQPSAGSGRNAKPRS